LLNYISAEALDTLFTTLHNFIVYGNIVTGLEGGMLLLSSKLVVYKLNCCVHNSSFLRTAKVVKNQLTHEF
jgi:hypothetical protein